MPPAIAGLAGLGPHGAVDTWITERAAARLAAARLAANRLPDFNGYVQTWRDWDLKVQMAMETKWRGIEQARLLGAARFRAAATAGAC